MTNTLNDSNLFLDLYGSNNLEAAQIDVVLDTLLDLNNKGLAIGPYFMEKDQAKQVSSFFLSKTRKLWIKLTHL